MGGVGKDYVLERIEVDDESGCWLWTRSRNNQGYANTGRGLPDGHRLAYELWIGPIPHRGQVDHLCPNKHCVNPEHLQAVSQSQNRLRDYARRHGQHSRTVVRVSRWLHNEVTARIDRAGGYR